MKFWTLIVLKISVLNNDNNDSNDHNNNNNNNNNNNDNNNKKKKKNSEVVIVIVTGTVSIWAGAVAVTRLPLRRFSPGAGLLRYVFFTLSTLRFSRGWVRKEGNLLRETGCTRIRRRSCLKRSRCEEYRNNALSTHRNDVRSKQCFVEHPFNTRPPRPKDYMFVCFVCCLRKLMPNVSP